MTNTSNPDKGESEGYTVKTKDEDFAISDYPLLQSEFLYASTKGTAGISIYMNIICII